MSKKITDLTSATTPLAGTEVVEIVQGGVSKKVAASYLAGGGGGREVLSANRTYYVRTDGSDSNDGLANTSGGAFLTIQKAIDSALLLDGLGYSVTIQVADGTYSPGSTAATFPTHMVGGMSLTLVGNTTTPANCVISPSSGSCILVQNGTVNISGFKLVASSGYGVWCTGGVANISSMEYGACSAHQNRAMGVGSSVAITGAVTISGNSGTFLHGDGGGAVQLSGSTTTFSGTRTYSTAFVYLSRLGHFRTFTMTWAGTYASVVGKKYDYYLNSVGEHNGVTLVGGTGGTAVTGSQVSA